VASKSPDSTALVVRAESRVATLVRELPALVVAAGKPAEIAWDDFFEGRLANLHTKKAYNRAIWNFLEWAQDQGRELAEIRAGDVGRYLREHPGSPPTQKQVLAALRRFFNLLVERHIVMINPAAVAQTERYSVVEGKTVEITKEQIRTLLERIDTTSVVGLGLPIAQKIC